MGKVSVVIICIAMIGMSVSCKKEGIADYISYENDSLNNPNGFLEDYGDPFNMGVNLDFFRNSNWTVTVISPSSPDLEYNMFVDIVGLKVHTPSTPNNYYFANFSSNEPYKAFNQYARNEMDFTISNGDKRLSGRWFKYGNSNRLILARRKVTLIFTRR